MGEFEKGSFSFRARSSCFSLFSKWDDTPYAGKGILLIEMGSHILILVLNQRLSWATPAWEEISWLPKRSLINKYRIAPVTSAQLWRLHLLVLVRCRRRKRWAFDLSGSRGGRRTSIIFVPWSYSYPQLVTEGCLVALTCQIPASGIPTNSWISTNGKSKHLYNLEDLRT